MKTPTTFFAAGIILLSMSTAYAAPLTSDAWHRDAEGQWYPGRVPTPEQQAERLRIRAQIMERASERLKSLIDIDGSNDPAELVDGRAVISNLVEMESRGLMRAELPDVPWSDDYWATYRGGLGARYADPNFPDTIDWKEMRDYVVANPVSAILERRRADELRTLSPSEKYSLWIGDANDRLTTKMWQEGQWSYSNEGKVETWMGLCHGWAAAAFMERKPLRKITLPSAIGDLNLEFYPADIKALTTLLWSKTDTETRFIGRRCNEKDPARDELGRVKDPACADMNAGAWHMAVVSQVGGARRSMILDTTYDYEVWNQPIYSYRYSYFNPRTNRPARSLQQATVNVADWPNDRFRRHRSNRTVAVVGISMELTYGIETRPVQADDESGFEEGLRTVRYAYDVELDADGKIVGGEWHQRQHPDFLWVPALGATPFTYGDYLVNRGSRLEQPNLLAMLTLPWRNAAAESARRTQPMMRLVRALIDESRER